MEKTKEITLHLAGDNEFKILMSPSVAEALADCLEHNLAKIQDIDRQTQLATLALHETIFRIGWCLCTAVFVLLAHTERVTAFITGELTFSGAAFSVFIMAVWAIILITIPFDYRKTRRKIASLSKVEY